MKSTRSQPTAVSTASTAPAAGTVEPSPALRASRARTLNTANAPANPGPGKTASPVRSRASTPDPTPPAPTGLPLRSVKNAAFRAQGLQALAQVKKELAQRQRIAAQAAAQERERQAQQQRQQQLFRLAVGAVQPLRQSPQANLRPSPPPPHPRQRELDEAAALREALSDEVDISTLLETDEGLSFRRPGIGADVLTRLRRGEWSVQAQVDLHGLRTDQAREALGRFVNDTHAQGLRCVRVVHGKGLGSLGKTPVLKDKVRRWLVQKSEVAAFVQAPPMHGGAGAVLVLLQARRRTVARA